MTDRSAGTDASLATATASVGTITASDVNFGTVGSFVWLDAKDQTDFSYPLIAMTNPKIWADGHVVLRSFAQTFTKEYVMKRTDASHSIDFGAQFTPSSTDPCHPGVEASIKQIVFTGDAALGAKIGSVSGNVLTLNPAGLYGGDTTEI